MEHANRFRAEVFRPAHNARFAIPAAAAEAAFVRFASEPADIPCVHDERVSPATAPVPCIPSRSS